MIDLISLIAKYLDNLNAKNYSNDTIRIHIHYLNRFIAYLKDIDIKKINTVTGEIVRDYQVHLYQDINRHGKPNSVSSQNQAMQIVKTFFRFLCESGYLVGNPTKNIPYAKEPRRLPRSILTQSEMRKLLSAPDKTTAIGYRDRTILELLYSAGIRKGEITNLVIENLDYVDGFLRVCGKGKKERVVPVGKIACRYLENYIKAVRPELIKANVKNNGYLFLSLNGKKLSKNMLWTIIKRYAKKAKIKKNISPHTIRHTCATLMLRNKANIRHIQEMLGHSNLNTTQIYTHIAITELKEIHKRCHPREREDEG